MVFCLGYGVVPRVSQSATLNEVFVEEVEKCLSLTTIPGTMAGGDYCCCIETPSMTMGFSSATLYELANVGDRNWTAFDSNQLLSYPLYVFYMAEHASFTFVLPPSLFK